MHSLILLFSLLFWNGEGKDSAQEDAVFQKSVEESIRRGVAWLKTQQRADGGFGAYEASKPGRVFKSGLTALSLLTLLSCGEGRSSDPVQHSTEFLLQNPPTLTYELGLSLMAMDLKGAPPLELYQLGKMSPKDLANYNFPREFSSAEKGFLEAAAKKLIDSRRGGLWAYGDEEATPDLSNSQYAILGLKAAARCKIPIPGEVWSDALKYFLQFQTPKGASVNFEEAKPKGDGFVTVSAFPRGWSYGKDSQDPNDVYGSRINIGICCLILSREELEIRKENAELLARLRTRLNKFDAAIRDARAWLATHFSVETNPPKGDFLYYYLYSLERMGTLTNSKYVGRHDWYREGAEYLIKAQQASGSWPGQGWSPEIADTCFALLFLKKATLPSVITGVR